MSDTQLIARTIEQFSRMHDALENMGNGGSTKTSQSDDAPCDAIHFEGSGGRKDVTVNLDDARALRAQLDAMGARP